MSPLHTTFFQTFQVNCIIVLDFENEFFTFHFHLVLPNIVPYEGINATKKNSITFQMVS